MKPGMRHRRGLAHVLVIVAMVVGGLVATASPAFAANDTWTGNTSTDWNTATNWQSGSIPTSGDTLTIPPGKPRSPVVAAGVTAVAKSITLAAGTGAVPTLTMTGGSLTLSSGGQAGLMIDKGSVT